MEHEPTPFDPNSMREEIDGTISNTNPDLAEKQLKKELEEAGLLDQHPFPENRLDDAA